MTFCRQHLYVSPDDGDVAPIRIYDGGDRVYVSPLEEASIGSSHDCSPEQFARVLRRWADRIDEEIAYQAASEATAP